MGTYSFLDVKAAITGPGGSLSIGSDAGAAEEGLTVAMAGEKNTMTIGAGGTPMHSLHADKSGKITIRLLKTSALNQALSQMYNFQTSGSSVNHGRNTITITDFVRGDVVTAREVAFSKQPDLQFAKEGSVNEWVFDCGIIDEMLGRGL